MHSLLLVPPPLGPPSWSCSQSQQVSQYARICSSTCRTRISFRARPWSGWEKTMLCSAALARILASLAPGAPGVPLRPPISASVPCRICSSNGKQPERRMATQLSGELDMARSVRAVSSWSRVASMDSSQKTTSTCRRVGMEASWGHPPGSPGPNQPTHPPQPGAVPTVWVTCPKHARSPVTPPPRPEEFLPYPYHPHFAPTHSWGDGQEASITVEMPPAHEGQMPTPLASSGTPRGGPTFSLEYHPKHTGQISPPTLPGPRSHTC